MTQSSNCGMNQIIERLFPPTNPRIASALKHQSACKLMFSDTAYCKAARSQSQLFQGALPMPCWKFKTNPVVICNHQRNVDRFLKTFFLHGCLATPTDCRLRFSCSLVLCEWPVDHFRFFGRQSSNYFESIQLCFSDGLIMIF